MKKESKLNFISQTLFIIFVLFITTKSLCSFASETYYIKGKFCKVIVAKLNIRSGPGTNYSIIGSLKSGDNVSIKKIAGEWAQLAQSEEAWVYKKCLNLPGSKKGIGVSYNQVMRDISGIFIMEKAPSIKGEDRYLGKSRTESATLEITCNSNNVSKAFIMFWFQSSDNAEIRLERRALATLFLRNTLPEIKDIGQFFSNVTEKALANKCEDMFYYKGYKKIEANLCPKLGLFTILVKRDDSI